MAESRSAFALSVLDAAPKSTPGSRWLERMEAGADPASPAPSPMMDLQPGFPTSRNPLLADVEPRSDELRIPMQQKASRRWSSSDNQTLLSRARSPTPRTSPHASPHSSRPPSPAPPRSRTPQIDGLDIRQLTRASAAEALATVTDRFNNMDLRRMSIDAATHAVSTVTSPRTYIQMSKSFVHFVLSQDPSLLAYFFLSVAVVISNKTLLRGYFPFPWMLLGVVQMGSATLGTMGAAKVGSYRATRLSAGHETLVRVVSVLFSCEQLASILSLRLVTVPFHISVRALSPVLTLLLSVAFFNQRSSVRTISSCLVILLGVILTSHSIPDIHSYGSLLTFVSMILSSAKTLVNTHLLQDRFSLKPLDIVARISPLTTVHCLFFSWANGEMDDLYRFVRGPEFTRGHVGAIAFNGLLSFALVVIGIVTDKRTRPPSMAISGHASQAFTTIIATIVFGLSLSPLNFLGVALTLGGSALSAWNEALDSPAPLPVGKILPD